MQNYPACKDIFVQALCSAETAECIPFVFGGNSNTSTFANSEDPDEMQHYAAFHQGLHCKGINDFQAEEYIIF